VGVRVLVLGDAGNGRIDFPIQSTWDQLRGLCHGPPQKHPGHEALALAIDERDVADSVDRVQAVRVAAVRVGEQLEDRHFFERLRSQAQDSVQGD